MFVEGESDFIIFIRMGFGVAAKSEFRSLSVQDSLNFIVLLSLPVFSHSGCVRSFRADPR